MGRNKIKIEKIENSKIRQVTFYKRKRGLLKKAMELSLLCESKIFLCIVDKVEKLTIYSSEININNFLGTYIQKLNQNKIQHKDILSNNDVHKLYKNQYKSLFDTDKKLNSQIEANIKIENDESLIEEAEKDFNNPSKSQFFSENIEFDEKNYDDKIQYLAFNQEQQFDSNAFFLNHNTSFKQGI